MRTGLPAPQDQVQGSHDDGFAAPVSPVMMLRPPLSSVDVRNRILDAKGGQHELMFVSNLPSVLASRQKRCMTEIETTSSLRVVVLGSGTSWEYR